MIPNAHQLTAYYLQRTKNWLSISVAEAELDLSSISGAEAELGLLSISEAEAEPGLISISEAEFQNFVSGLGKSDS